MLLIGHVRSDLEDDSYYAPLYGRKLFIVFWSVYDAAL